MTVARRSSVESRAVAWKRYICPTIEEISFEPAVISFLVIAFLSTSIRRVAKPTPPGRCSTPCASCPSVLPDPTASAVGSPSPDNAAHCLASRATSSADRRSNWMSSASHVMRLERHVFCVSQILFISPDDSHRKACQGMKRPRCCTAALKPVMTIVSALCWRLIQVSDIRLV
jgi:hypothetical protein